MSERAELVSKHEKLRLRLDDLDREHEVIRQQHFHTSFWNFRRRNFLMGEANRVMKEARELRSKATGIFMAVCVMDGREPNPPHS